MSEAKKSSNLKDFSRLAPVEEKPIRVDLIYVIDKINTLSDLYISSLGFLININHFVQVSNYFGEFVRLAEEINDEIDVYNLDQLIKHENKLQIMSAFKADLSYMGTQTNIILTKLELLKDQIEKIEGDLENEQVKSPLIKLDHKLTHISHLITDVKRAIDQLLKTDIKVFVKQLPEDNDEAIKEVQNRLEKIKQTVRDMFELQKTKALLLKTLTNK